MDNFSLGSGAALLGGTDPLQEAMSRRQTDQAGITQQVTPASANFQPQPTTPTQASPQQSMGQAPQPGLPTGPMEAEIILKALDGRLKSLSKQEEAKLING